MTYIQRKSISGLTSDESERMRIREGKIRGTNKLSYRNYKDCVAAMQDEVVGLRDKFKRTSQEAKEKLQQENPAGSGSGLSHK